MNNWKGEGGGERAKVFKSLNGSEKLDLGSTHIFGLLAVDGKIFRYEIKVKN